MNLIYIIASLVIFISGGGCSEYAQTTRELQRRGDLAQDTLATTCILYMSHMKSLEVWK